MKKYAFILLTLILAMNLETEAQKKTTKVLISTEYGDIKIELFNDTPKHRDNFVKLAKEGFYNGSIFHRVIKQFMIQGGGAPAGKEQVTYTIPAEFVPAHIHKKGALAAARMGDQVNPTKASSGSQFYIVQGKVYTSQELDMFEKGYGKKFTAEQRTAYTTVGGTPHLDGEYTVFGQVISGIEVVDKIAVVKTAPGDKPYTDVKMTVKVL